MTKRVWSGGLGNGGGGHGIFHGALDDMIAFMMAADDFGAWVGRETGGRKKPEPGPLLARVGVFGIQAEGHEDAGEVLGAVLVEELAGMGKLVAEGIGQAVRDHGDAVLAALAKADVDAAAGEVEVFDAEGKHLVEPDAGAVEDAGHQQGEALQMLKHAVGFVFVEDEWESSLVFGVDKLVKLADRDAKDVPIEKNDAVEGLVLRRRGDIAVHGEVGEERGDGGGLEFGGRSSRGRRGGWRGIQGGGGSSTGPESRRNHRVGVSLAGTWRQDSRSKEQFKENVEEFFRARRLKPQAVAIGPVACWGGAMRWYLQWLERCQTQGLETRSVGERMWDAVRLRHEA